VTIRIGISGWRYRGWRGRFYPEGLPQRCELDYASRRMGSIEINGTFYSLQRATYFRRWRTETPDDFVFAVKGSRFVTHMKKLRDVETPLANFFASGLLALGPKLGPILWQFPPNFAFDPERIEKFFRFVPRRQKQAAALAREHDARAKDPCVEAEGDWPVRHAMEIRHKSFVTPEFAALLRKLDVALVIADAVEWPYLEDVTASFVYCRLHGSKELYASGYGPKALDGWAERVRAWSRGGEARHDHCASPKKPAKRKSRDVYVYFDNDAKVRAPVDAINLMKRLDLAPKRGR
jgi:uncharacterized protein YecE (DUF72 family)